MAYFAGDSEQSGRRMRVLSAGWLKRRQFLFDEQALARMGAVA
jgi:hypothetical protein